MVGGGGGGGESSSSSIRTGVVLKNAAQIDVNLMQ